MHLRHFNFVDFFAIHIKLANTAEFLRLDEIEFQVGLAANGCDNTVFLALEINLRLDRVCAILDRC